jgi:hypothetical protein
MNFNPISHNKVNEQDQDKVDANKNGGVDGAESEEKK